MNGRFLNPMIGTKKPPDGQNVCMISMMKGRCGGERGRIRGNFLRREGISPIETKLIATLLRQAADVEGKKASSWFCRLARLVQFLQFLLVI